MTQRITAFVAKSFNAIDEAKIEPIVKILKAFHKMGFFLGDAEQAEVESVSKKVRTLIDEADVLVGFFTRRHPIYRLESRWSALVAILRGNLRPTSWSAPPWVLQESGYALKGNKALILFKEEGVEIPGGLQGDLEYISFDPQNPQIAIQRATEMVNDLIARKSNIKIDTTVLDAPPMEAKGGEAATPPVPPKADEDANSGKDDLASHLPGLLAAVREKEWIKAEAEYEEGLTWIRANSSERELFWKVFYQRLLFEHGKTEALDELRSLASNNPKEPYPRSVIASSLLDLREFDDSAKFFLEAAALSAGNDRAVLMIRAAEVLRKAEKLVDAKNILLPLLQEDYAQDQKTQFNILRILYSLSKGTDDKFESFSIAELALHQSPEELSFRFSLAYDYESATQSLLALYHYKIICKHDEKFGSALNNYGVALLNCDLPILAAKCFKRAYELDDTLAASNLGHRYLTAGLADEAISLLKSAQSKEDSAPQVSKTLAAVYEKLDENESGEESSMKAADKHRQFLLAFAKGTFAANPVNLAGRWKFDKVAILLQVTGTMIYGTNETRTESDAGIGGLSGIGGPLLSAPDRSITTIERDEFKGTLKGRSCKFKLEVKTTTEPFSWRLNSDSDIEGYIVFAEDGLSGDIAELEDGKPGKQYKISRIS